MSTSALKLAVALGIAVGTIAAPVSAQPLTATRTYHRQLNIYYGTWTVLIQGNPTPVTTQTLVELSDHISSGLRFSILDAAVDPRVDASISLWVFPPDLTNIEWILGTPENLPAIANFNAGIAALGGSVSADSGFQPRGTHTYELDSFVTTETAPVVIGDPDGIVFGADGETVEVTNRFVADVSYFERNGSVTLPSIGRCPLSHGYWKNNLSLWTVPTLTLGSVPYTRAQLVGLLNEAGTKDASVILARQLIATKLNVLYGADPTPVTATIGQADALLGATYVPALVAPNSPLGKSMTARARTLDDFNNGQLTTICVP